MTSSVPIKFVKIKRMTLKWEKEFREFYKDCLSPRMIRNPDAAYFAAYCGKLLVGHAALVKENGKYLLEGLRVRPEFREKGIGKELTRLRLSYALEKGAKTVWYRAADKNLVSICCHMKFGFKKVCKPGEKCGIGKVVWYKLNLSDEQSAKKILTAQLR
ncbi:MAG: GNAT family N-acetyltransferase [Elusimicrobia bacterium]|nr:GNAT family N-acetyltransferase [Elusimicrobiota bacterium]